MRNSPRAGRVKAAQHRAPARQACAASAGLDTPEHDGRLKKTKRRRLKLRSGRSVQGQRHAGERWGFCGVRCGSVSGTRERIVPLLIRASTTPSQKPHPPTHSTLPQAPASAPCTLITNSKTRSPPPPKPPALRAAPPRRRRQCASECCTKRQRRADNGACQCR